MFHIYCVFHDKNSIQNAPNQLYRVSTSYEVCNITRNVENPSSMLKKKL